MITVIDSIVQDEDKSAPKRLSDVPVGAVFSAAIPPSDHCVRSRIRGHFLRCKDYGGSIDGVVVDVCVIQLYPTPGNSWLKDVPIEDYKEVDATLIIKNHA